MRRTAVLIVWAGLTVAAQAGETPAFPDYDIEKFCRTQARYSYAATLGDSSFDGVYATCTDNERENKALAQGRWRETSVKFAQQCLDLAEGRYTYLMRCLEGERSMRSAR